MGLSENRVSLNLCVDHHVRSYMNILSGIPHVQTDPYTYGTRSPISSPFHPLKNPFKKKNANLKNPPKKSSELSKIRPELRSVSQRRKGIARALDHLHVVQHLHDRRCIAAEVA